MRTSHWFLIGLLWIAASSSALAAARTWNGSAGDSNWFNAVNWDGGVTIPQDGDSVTIPAGSQVWLTNATAYLDTFEITNATFTFRDTTNLTAVLQATNLLIHNGSFITHGTNTATTTNVAGGWDIDGRVYIACSNLTLDAGGQINADECGYKGAPPGSGYGPGRGGAPYGGGGYGGQGGTGNSGTPGATYGSATNPVQPGSSGGAHAAHTGVSGSGGGAVRIVAQGRVTVNGVISADGGNGPSPYSAGGSGGAIFIQCATFAGTGTNSAIGGNGFTDYGGGGGGGRIAVVYTDLAGQSAVSPKPTIRFLLTGGQGTGNGSVYGTLYLADNSFFLQEAMYGNYWISIAGLTNWSPNNLTVTNGTIQFDDGFWLNVTNTLTIASGGGIDLRNHATLTCNNLTLTNGLLYVRAGVTNGAAYIYGALVSVANAFLISPLSTNYLYSDPTNGGSVLMRMANLTVQNGGKIDADGKGYRAADAGGNGWGPGQGAAPYGGGGYGGLGGEASGIYGQTYGSSNAPVDPGSSGGEHSVGYGAPAAGGAVQIQAGNTVQIDGTISANSGAGSGQYWGGSSGGGIFITCKTFKGGGSITASGGIGDGSGGGGGGGRIAIWRQRDQWTGASLTATNAVKGGTGPGAAGGVGTVFLMQLPLPGTIFTFR